MSNKANKINFTGISQNTHYTTVGYGESIASYQWFDPIHRTLPAIINEVMAHFPGSMITDMVHNNKNLVITFENVDYIIEIFVESAE